MAESAMTKIKGNAAQPGGGGVTIPPLELSAGTDHGPQQRRKHMLRDPSIPRLLSTVGAAKLLGVSRQRVLQLIEEERLPAVRASGLTVLAEETVSRVAAGESIESIMGGEPR